MFHHQGVVVGPNHRLAGPLTMYKQYRCASPRPSGTALPPILVPSYLFIPLLLQTRLFPAHRVKKRVARETKPLVSDLQLSHPRQSNRQT